MSATAAAAARAAASGDIAIVGMSCRFPGEGEGVDGFWQSISSGKSAWSQIPADRFNYSAYWSPHKRRGTSITYGGFFLRHDLASFDAGFFTLPKAEARAMDPQQRILVEVAYEALESAGLPLSKVAGTRTGVYIGDFTHDYYELLRRDTENLPTLTLNGTASTAMSGRLSWLWDLHGPCFALDTACSSGLVALHLAVQGLRAGDADAALVGGANLLISPDMFKAASAASFLAPDGRSKAFDASADGYGRGEGIGVVVLKRVEDAVRDGDPIRAVIRGTACNQDGRTPGMTLPSSDAQATLIREAYRKAGLDMHETGYVEAHGTGTQAGDQEETKSISSTIASAKKQHVRKEKLLIGSVKSNIGHLEACAGIAALIKTVLVLEHGLIPPTITAKNLNPKIPFAPWNLLVPTALTPFPCSGPLRRASINSFGFCGTNAHAIVEDASSYLQSHNIAYDNHSTRHGNAGKFLTNGTTAAGSSSKVSTAAPLQVFVISAQDRDGVGRVRKTLATYLVEKLKFHGRKDVEFLADLAHTLNARRTIHQWKTYAIAASIQELVDDITNKETPRPEHLGASRAPRLGFVFTGQGAQWGGMGMELMAYPVFSDSIEAADAYLRNELDCPWSATEELRRSKADSKLGGAEFSQPLCTVLQVALVDLLCSWGITPTAVTGHSSGEIGAAYCAGALSRQHAWKLAYYRGLLSSESTLQGSMMAVGMSPEDAHAAVDSIAPGEVTVACINSPSSVTLSGDTAGIERLLAALTKDGVFARKLQVDTAYHSHHMQMLASDYMEAIMDVTTQTGIDGCIMQSSASGTKVMPSQLGPAHWVRNLVSPVHFAGAVQDLVRPMEGKARAGKVIDVLVEIGPHSALQGPSLQSLKAIGVTDVPYLSALSRWSNGTKTCLALAGDLFARSFPVDITAVNAAAQPPSSSTPHVLVDLPRYPWNHSQRYWAETRWAREHRLRQFAPLSLLGAPQPTVDAGERAWRGYMRMSEQPWTADHQIQGSTLYPGAGFLTMAIEAAHQSANGDRTVRGFHLKDVQLVLPMVLQEDHDVEYSIVLRPHLSGTMSTSSAWDEFVISSSPDGNTFERNCLGLVQVDYADDQGLPDARDMRRRIDDIAAKCNVNVEVGDFYENLTSLGLAYGPTFANASSIRVRPGLSHATVDVPDVGLEDVLRTGKRPHVIHPALLDSVFHTFFAAVLGEGRLSTAMIPKSFDSVYVSIDSPYMSSEKVRGVCEARPQGLKEYMTDIYMEDQRTGKPALTVKGLCVRKVAGDREEGGATTANALCTQVVWRPHIDMLDGVAWAKSSEGGALAKLAELVRLAHHVNPSLTLVEATTTDQLMLPKLDLPDGVFATTSYQIASSEEMASAVPELLSSLGTNVRHRTIDLEESLASETFSPDFIIAIDDGSPEAESSIKALSKKLPSKGGRICVVEKSTPGAVESRANAAGLATSMVLEDGKYTIRVLTRKPTDVNGVNAAEEIVILSNGRTPIEENLIAKLEAYGYKTVVVAWGDLGTASALNERRCISLLELERPIFDELSEDDFAKTVNIFKNAMHMTWVVGSQIDKPSTAMSTGMLRVLHNELPGLEPICISVDAASRTRPDALVAQLVRIFRAPLGEREFHVIEGVPLISRLVPDNTINDTINSLVSPKETQEPVMESLADATAGGRPLRLLIGQPGRLESLRFQVEDTAEAALQADEVEIDVKASALNSRDVMTIMDLIPGATLGSEASGVVRRIGSEVSHLKIGARVALIGDDAHASVMRGKALHAYQIPDSMTFEQAASLPVTSYTAWYGLVHLGRAHKGQTVLIHAGAGGVGQSALQLARELGLEVFTTVGSEDERKVVHDRYGVADDHIFSSQDLGFAQGVMKLTRGRGVDIVLNSLTGEALHRSWECVAPSGHFVEIGVRDIIDNTRLSMRQFARGATFSALNLIDLYANQAQLMAKVVAGAKPYLDSGVIRPAEPLVCQPISELVDALRLLQSGNQQGKVIMQWTSDAAVPVVRPPLPPLNLEDGVFLLVGGTGGLGRSIARMLVSHGAKKLCFLSRSAGTSADARALQSELDEQGVQVRMIACDISDAGSVDAALAQCTAELGPVRGVFQGAVVLRDALFSKMTYDEWVGSTRSKVQGSSNLSAALPDVDFFVLMSSFTNAFGNRGQVNYSAGNAFQNALAAARVAQGQRAVSVDLGVIRDVGAVAENGTQGDLKAWERVWGIREDRFLALMRVCMQAGDVGLGPRVVTGLGTRAGSLAAGIKPPYYFETDPRMGVLAHVGGGNGTGDGVEGVPGGDDGGAASLAVAIPATTTLQDAASLVLAALVARVAHMLDLPPSDLDTERPLHSYGVDSLTAIDIVNWALRSVGARIAVFDVMAAVPMAVFSERLVARSTFAAHLVEAE